MNFKQVLRNGMVVVLALILALGVWGGLPAQKVAAEACTTPGDYRSVASGNWDNTATWEYCDSSNNWTPATSTPTFNDGIITIRNGHVVTVAANLTVDQLIIESGGQLTVNSGVTLSTNDGSGDEITVYGTFLHSGIVPSPINGTGVLASGGTYIHNTTSSATRMYSFFTTIHNDSNWVYRGSSSLNTAFTISGKTYGNLAFESSSGTWNATNTGTNQLTVNNFSVGNGVNLNLSNFTGKILVKGNWTMNGAFSHGGEVAFDGAGEHILDGNNSTTFNHLTVNNGAILVEAKDASVTNTLTNNGTIRNIKTVSGSGIQTFGLTGVSIEVTTQGTLTSLQVDRIDSNHPNAPAGIQTGRYWSITPTGNGYTVNLTLPHANFDNPKVCKYPGELGGAGWDCERTTFDSTTVTRNGITSFSDWAVGNGVGKTTVALSHFSVQPVRVPLWVFGLLTIGTLIAIRRKK